MLENLRFYTGFLHLLSGIIGIAFWYKLPNNRAKLFLFSIWFSVLVEVIGNYFTEWTGGLLNYWVFNVYIFVLFSVYIMLLKSLLKRVPYRCIATFFLISFMLVSILNWLFLQNGMQTILTYSYAVGVIFITILSAFYLFELFSTNLILSYSKSIYFWFVLGILIFHVPFLPFMLSLDWFLIKVTSTTYGIILFFLNLLMNTSFIIGFIWSQKKYNY
jgi:hypothetical protein